MSEPRVAYLVDSVTGKTLAMVHYIEGKEDSSLRELIAGLDTPRTFSVELGSIMHVGVQVRSSEVKFN